MDYYYPDRIAEDDISSCGSAEIALHPMRHKIQSTSDAYADGGISSVRRIDDDNDDDNSLLASSDGRHGGTGESHDEKGAPKSSRGEGLGTNHNESNAVANDLDEQNYKNMAALIKNERNRRLGVREHADADNGQAHPPPSSNELPAPSNPVGVLGNIRGWFGVGGSAVVSRQSFTPVSHTQNNYSSHHLHRGAPLQKNTPPELNIHKLRGRHHPVIIPPLPHLPTRHPPMTTITPRANLLTLPIQSTEMPTSPLRKEPGRARCDIFPTPASMRDGRPRLRPTFGHWND